MNTIKALAAMKLPDRTVTDRFGSIRDWALPGRLDPDTQRPGWHPQARYRPIHYGMDFRVTNAPQIFAPCDCHMSYDDENRMILIVPQLSSPSRPAYDCIIYYRHVVAGSGFETGWHTTSRGSVIGTADLNHRWPHLHMEIAITVSLYLEMKETGYSLFGPVSTVADMTHRGSLRNFDDEATRTRLNNQIESDGITLVEGGAIWRKQFPAYKRCDYSYLGRENVVLVSPDYVLGMGA
tara:strand:- start:3676 stop:4386 length:711 start_codon:yes stop_codon:yes gene_type:complete